MISKEMTVKLSGGMEARPVAVLVQVASQYESSVYLQVGEGKRVNAKSIMGMMSLGLDAGEKVTVVTDGSDEAVAMDEIEKFLGSENE
ncbi:MAG: HPr family phosphocarrier protein [Lachnospiraceae bacterium]|nr:HPr family phosphocarrier protein [Lachnospiraceae bacterium]